jgi:hypothetical protein
MSDLIPPALISPLTVVEYPCNNQSALYYNGVYRRLRADHHRCYYRAGAGQFCRAEGAGNDDCQSVLTPQYCFDIILKRKAHPRPAWWAPIPAIKGWIPFPPLAAFTIVDQRMSDLISDAVIIADQIEADAALGCDGFFAPAGAFALRLGLGFAADRTYVQANVFLAGGAIARNLSSHLRFYRWTLLSGWMYSGGRN